jgi:hypothetical protein
LEIGDTAGSNLRYGAGAPTIVDTLVRTALFSPVFAILDAVPPLA